MFFLDHSLTFCAGKIVVLNFLFSEFYSKIYCLFCRYEVEGRSAGALQGISSTAQSKTYPKIKIHGYQVCIHGLNLFKVSKAKLF